MTDSLRKIDISEQPWAGEPDAAACNFALGNLCITLPQRLMVNGRIHAETYVAAAGAIAGFAAQCGLFESFKPAIGTDMQIAKTSAGDFYWFGDPLNYMLMPRTESDARTTLWPLAAGQALHVGLARERLPDPRQMFAHVASAIGSSAEGWPSASARHRPVASARDLLKTVWPLAVACFSGRIPGAERDYGEAGRKWWSAIAAHAAPRSIRDVKDVLAPDIALTILMETAIYCSKIEAASIESQP
jgi:hypothetical protein